MINNNNNNFFTVDDSAKIRCDLFKHTDKEGNFFYTGKLQFNGTLDFIDGQNFMIFTSEEDKEELQIGPIDPARTSKKRESKITVSNGRTCISLIPHTDSNGKTFYVGEARFNFVMPCKTGIFFSVFISKAGREELQISKLNIKKKKPFRQYTISE